MADEPEGGPSNESSLPEWPRLPASEEGRRARRKAAEEWVRSKWGDDGKPCPVCGWTAWAVQDLADLPIRSITDEGEYESYPVVPLICRNCGYFLLFNALVIDPPFDTSRLPRTRAYEDGEDESGSDS